MSGRPAPRAGARTPARPSGLAAVGLSAGHGARLVLDGLDLAVSPGRVTAVVGPNASGKSTLLAALARVLPVRAGSVLLDGQDIRRLPTREVATRLGILPQDPLAPDGITVHDLVGRGRHPHRRLGGRLGPADERVVAESLLLTGTADLARRGVDTLSGGQRQRVWIAMALAQQTPVLLLDEPTSALDIAHQVEVLDLLLDLNREQGLTVVLVLHDLNHAARYADVVVALRDGAVVAHGPPAEVITAALVAEVFGVSCRVVADPDTGCPVVLPRGRHDRAAPVPPLSRSTTLTKDPA